MKLVDVNILLYAVDKNSSQHHCVSAWLDDALNQDEAVGFAWLVLTGFLRISTNPKAYPVPLTIKEAVRQVEIWLSRPNVRVVHEFDNHWNLFRQLVSESGTSGNRTTDAHLAALAISHNAILASCDHDFARFRGLRWENPLA